MEQKPPSLFPYQPSQQKMTLRKILDGKTDLVE
jgi:hypothetical protein